MRGQYQFKAGDRVVGNYKAQSDIRGKEFVVERVRDRGNNACLVYVKLPSGEITGRYSYRFDPLVISPFDQKVRDYINQELMP